MISALYTIMGLFVQAWWQPGDAYHNVPGQVLAQVESQPPVQVLISLLDVGFALSEDPSGVLWLTVISSTGEISRYTSADLGRTWRRWEF